MAGKYERRNTSNETIKKKYRICEKCGVSIPCNSVFCSNCGTKLVEPLTDKENVTTENTEKLRTDAETSISTKLINGKRISLIFLVIAMIIISFFLINEAVTCDMGNCNNAKLENSNYCNLHTCSYPDCQYCKGKYDDYCFIHLDELSCSDVDCNQLKTNNSDYCFNHTCTKSGCSSKRFLDSEYCSEHQINMREMLPDPSFSFKLDSAGGIVFNFEATNKTERVIKYVRFDVELYNAVGDRIKDDIRRDYSIGVEIIGPVYQNCTVRMIKETIGYCDNCARIEIKDITIIYTDGTSETGRYNYYYER